MAGATIHGRLLYLDGLRGIAALAVLYQHLLEYAGAMAPDASWVHRHLNWSLDYLDFGKLGVVAFFAISGFIVPYSFAGDTPRLGFAISRFFRLYPAYWLSLLSAALLLPLLGAPPISLAQVLANATMLPSLWQQPAVLGVYWTLTIELTFYAMCFVLYGLGGLRSTKILVGLFVVMLAVAMGGALLREGNHAYMPVAAPLYLAVMLFGACLRLAFVERDRQAERCWLAMLAALLLAMPVAWMTAYTDLSHKESVLADVVAMELAVLLFVFATRHRAFAFPPLVHAGVISYSVYLFHPIALEVGSFVASNHAWPVAGLLLVAASLTLTFCSALLVHRMLERPAVRCGRRLLVRFSDRALTHVGSATLENRGSASG